MFTQVMRAALDAGAHLLVDMYAVKNVNTMPARNHRATRGAANQLNTIRVCAVSAWGRAEV